MTVADHPFSTSANPRSPDSCATCGRVPAVHPATLNQPQRDPQLEAEFLAEVIDLAEKQGQIRWEGYAVQVRNRLTIGAERYGDEAFFDRDNLCELLEETPDIAAYAVLELQRLRLQGADDDYWLDRLDLLAAAAHGALADHHVQRIVRRRAGLE